MQTLTICNYLTVQEVPVCPEFNVIQYYLLLQESTSNRSLITIGPSTAPTFAIHSPDINENSKYKYRLRAVNSVNISSITEEHEFSKLLFD